MAMSQLLDTRKHGTAVGLFLKSDGGNPEAALAEFATCIEHNPDYVPAYQMSAQTLLKLGRTDAALERIDAGVAAAVRTNNSHARSEMETMRDELAG